MPASGWRRTKTSRAMKLIRVTVVFSMPAVLIMYFCMYVVNV